MSVLIMLLIIIKITKNTQGNHFNISKLDSDINKNVQVSNSLYNSSYNFTEVRESKEQNKTSPKARNVSSSKQLQLQFVLDCKMIDPITKQEITVAKPQSSISTAPNDQFEYIKKGAATNYQTTLQPKTTRKLRTTTAWHQNPLIIQSILSQTQFPPIASTTEKLKVKHVYVDPPAIDAIGNVMDGFYDFFENTFTEPKITKNKKNTPKKSNFNINPTINALTVPTKRRHRPNTQTHVYSPPKKSPQFSFNNQQLASMSKYPAYTRFKRTTVYPQRPQYIAVDPQYEHNNPNDPFLTTKIHVTSQYGGPQTQPTVPMNKRKNTKQGSDDSSDYYDYNEALDINNLGDDDDDDDDDEDASREEDDGSEDDYDDDDIDVGIDDEDSDTAEDQQQVNIVDYPIPTDKTTTTVQKKKRKNKIKINKYKEEDTNSDEESYENADYDFTDNLNSYGESVGNFFSSVGQYVPRFPLILGRSNAEDINEQESQKTHNNNVITVNIDKKTDIASISAPHLEYRHPKQPSDNFYSYDYNSKSVENNKIDSDSDSSSWFGNNFFFASNEDTTTEEISTTTDSSNFFDWFGGSSNEEKQSSEENSSNTWFFGLFGGTPTTTTTTTTSRPFLIVENPMHKPQNWLGILAQHLSTTKKPDVINNDYLLRRKRYTNQQLWRLLPSTESQVRFLETYRSSPEGALLQWWKGPTLRGPTDIVVPLEIVTDVKESLKYEDISYDVVIWDLEKAIINENPHITKREKIELIKSQGHPLTWYRYHQYDDIIKYLEYIQRKHPNIIELIHIGRSFEGRTLIVAKISSMESDFENSKDSSLERRKKPIRRPAIFIEAGSHGREWIGPAVATWIIDSIIKDIYRNDTIGKTIQSVDWYIMPVLNPDGYEFTHEYDRFWRKTRSYHPDDNRSIFMKAVSWFKPKEELSERKCIGTDANRNWNYAWKEKGASKSKCSEFYAGPKPFSEPETKAVAKFLEENKNNLKIFLSLHSYGQILTYPSSANSSYNYIKQDDLMDMAQVAIESMRGLSGNTRYIIDGLNEMIYTRSGSSDSYAMHNIDIKYSYTLELRDTGTHGFLLPTSYIQPTAKEAFEMIKGMIDYM